MFTKLVIVTKLAIAPSGDISESYKVPFTARTVGDSVPAVLYAPVIACESVPLTKSTPVDILTHCAAGREGWLKL